MKFFKLSFDTAIWRFYLMMTVTLAAFYLGVPYLAILAAPIFLSIMLGITIDYTRKVDQSKATRTETTLPSSLPNAA